jgi:hypothetical protein
MTKRQTMIDKILQRKRWIQWQEPHWKQRKLQMSATSTSTKYWPPFNKLKLLCKRLNMTIEKSFNYL